MKPCQPLFLSLRGAKSPTLVIARSPAGRRGNLIFSAIIIAVFAFCFFGAGNVDFVFAASGSTLDFDGVDNYVVADYDTVFDQADRLSVSAWIQPDDTPAGDEYIVYRYNNYYLKIDSNRQIIAAVYGAAWAYATSTAITADGAEWMHIELTYDKDLGGTNELKVYIDGSLSGIGDYSTAITASTKKLYVGACDTAGDNSPENFFDGKIDDVRLYQYARSLSDVQMDYNNGLAVHLGGSVSSRHSESSEESCSTDPASCMDHGLVASYDFDEGDGQTLYNAADTGSANDGTLTNGPNWTEGKEGGGLDFDGTDDYVDCGNDSSLDITEAITIEAWVKSPDYASNGGIVHKGPLTDDQGVWNLMHFENTIRFRVSDPPVDGSGQVTATAPSINVWHHVVATYNKINQKIYIDGIEESSEDFTTAISTNNNSLYIGVYYAPTYNFSGSIDGVKIYNRALSAEEVRYHYNRGGPVGHWRMDEGEGSTAYDESSNDNDGTLHLGSSGNTATSSAWVAGNPSTSSGSAIDFDGTDDYVSRAYDADFDFGINSFTISSWFKHSVISSASDYLLSRYDSDQGFKLWMDDTGDMCFGIDDDATWGPDDSACTSGVDYDDNKWRHIVGYKDGTTGIYLYIDGILAASDTSLSATATLTSNSAPLHIGADAPTAGSYWDGLIDDVRIYAYARTPAQIQMDYNAGFGAHLK